MTRSITALGLVAALLALLCPALAHAEASDIAATARSVVRVVLVSEYDGQFELEGHGSGFAVAGDLIVTNAHVVEQARSDEHIRIGIVPSEGKSGWFAKIVAISPEKDLALLRLTEPGALPVATLFSGAASDGEDVFAVGYPGNVDLAQGLNVGDIISPTSPVKTRGNVSAGRSSKAFETILHTAPLGAGNSGGPLLDACGRVLGANSFGTIASGGDSEFYFAVSTREILRFLLALGVKPHTAGNPCRSFAAIDQAEAERSAGEQARTAEADRASSARQRDARELALHRSLFEIAEEREDWLGGAGLALLLALGLAGGAWSLHERGRIRDSRIAATGCGILVLAAGAAMLSRPGFNDVDSRAQRLLAQSSGTPGPAAAGRPVSGKLVCALLPDRSRVTVSDMADVALEWGNGGCVNAESQYALGSDGWSRVLVPDSEDTVTVSHFDADTAEYRVDRYFPDFSAMTALRDARNDLEVPACGVGEAAARRFGEAEAALAALLPAARNERLVYHCTQASGAE